MHALDAAAQRYWEPKATIFPIRKRVKPLFVYVSCLHGASIWLTTWPTSNRKLKMMPPVYAKPERIWLYKNAEYTERWVQDLIAQDPSIIGLGDLDLLAQERIQPRAGRLDLLLRDIEENRRYEVELQLGATDEAHIIRTIEYWDIERKRYPQYEHCAVLIAEDITSRFLNVISLFNGTMPFIAIQMQALKVGDNVTLVFTTVMDELRRGVVDEDEVAISMPSDRADWEKRASVESVTLADRVLQFAKGFDGSLNLKYNKGYVGVTRNGRAHNFMWFVPRKNNLIVEVKLPKTEEYDAKIADAELDALPYNRSWGSYRLQIRERDLKENREALSALLKTAYDIRSE